MEQFKALFNRLCFEILCYLPTYDSIKFLYMSLSLFFTMLNESKSNLVTDITRPLLVIASQAFCVFLSLLYLRVSLHCNPKSKVTLFYWVLRIVTICQESMLLGFEKQPYRMYIMFEVLLTTRLFRYYIQYNTN